MVSAQEYEIKYGLSYIDFKVDSELLEHYMCSLSVCTWSYSLSSNLVLLKQSNHKVRELFKTRTLLFYNFLKIILRFFVFKMFRLRIVSNTLKNNIRTGT